MSKVLITGATGFIGSHIAEYFLAKGVEVKCLVRENSDVSFLSVIGAELFTGNITDENSIINALENCDTVIHAAAYARDWGLKRKFTETNIGGTMNVVQAAKKCNIKKIIITGSILQKPMILTTLFRSKLTTQS